MIYRESLRMIVSGMFSADNDIQSDEYRGAR